MIPFTLWAELSRFQLLGARFVLVGDWEGQFEPICDRWKDTRKVRNCEFIRRMACGLHIKLEEYRRGEDSELFEFLQRAL